MDAKLAAFQQWMQANGVWLDTEKIEIVAESSESVCIRARTNLAVGDIVARIPKSAILSAETAELWRQSAIGASATDYSESVALTMAVMYEQFLGTRSKWHGYLSTLSNDYNPHIPLFWLRRVKSVLAAKSEKEIRRIMASADSDSDDDAGEEALEIVQGTELESALHVLDSLWSGFQEAAQPIFKRVSKGKKPCSMDYDLSFRHFLKTMSLVLSRCFGVDSHHRDSLVPVADLFNHRTIDEHVHLESEEPQFEETEDGGVKIIEDGGGDSIDMRIVRAVRAGDEVFNTYGKHSSTHLLIGYGFTETEENPFDVVNVDWEIIRVALQEWRASAAPPAGKKRKRQSKTGSEWIDRRLEFWQNIGAKIFDEMEESEQDDSEQDDSEQADESGGEELELPYADEDDDDGDDEEDDNDIYFQLHADGTVEHKFLAFIGTCVLPDDVFAAHCSDDEAFWSRIYKSCTDLNALDPKYSKNIAEIIVHAAQLRLARLNDIAPAAQQPPSINVQNALRIRASEKQLLSKTVDRFIAIVK